MRRTLVSTVVAVALPAVLLVGCGGTDGSGDAGDTEDAVVDPDADLGDDTKADVVSEEDDVTEDDASGETTEQPDDGATGDGDAAGGEAGGTHLAAPAALEPRVQEAITDLIDDGVDRDAIALVVAEPVVWADGSLGCPEPGMMYTQALVEGYRIVFEVDGDEVAYHGAGNEPPFRCDDPAEPAGGGDPTS